MEAEFPKEPTTRYQERSRRGKTGCYLKVQRGIRRLRKNIKPSDDKEVGYHGFDPIPVQTDSSIGSPSVRISAQIHSEYEINPVFRSTPFRGLKLIE